MVSLIHDAQEIAILTGKETLSLETLNEAYQKRLSLLHDYIQPTIIHNGQTSKPKKKMLGTSMIKKDTVNKRPDSDFTLEALVKKAKRDNIDIVELVGKYVTIIEVAV